VPMDHLLGCRWNGTAAEWQWVASARSKPLPFCQGGGNIAPMPGTSWSYRASLRLGTALAPALGLINSRIRAGYVARRKAGERLQEWARTDRDRARPLVWFHAASVGEGLQAQSVLRSLKQLRPECQFVFTHFSPSAEKFSLSLGADVSDYLPYDLPDRIDPLLQMLQPELLVFAKLDLWPELSTRAAARGADIAIVAGTVSPLSGRLRWPARLLLRPGYQVVSAAAAISAEDATRLARLGVAPDRIQVLGDPRFDSALDRVNAVAPDDPLLRFGHGAPTLVAGSTWPADEVVLLRAFTEILHWRSDVRLILVPHEPGAEHLAAIEQRAQELGLPAPVRLGNASGPTSLLLVDRVGVLATLYGAGVMAYVGGGFGRAGLHSVLEPAAWSLPVSFGPRWHGSRDARLLLEAGAAADLSTTSVGAATTTLQRVWKSWIENDAGRRAQGDRARRVVQAGLGASVRSARMLVPLISAPRLHRSPHGAPEGQPSVP
jgi:3-deoxy-D-manno-octulosonic-acid transferase